MSSAIQIHAGKTALAHMREHGLQAKDIAIIPAAAGGPKGLILQALDQWLFGEWLPNAERERSLIGASIGSWRMAAACHANPVAGFQKLAELYCEQRYSSKPSAHQVTEKIKHLLHDFIDGHEQGIIEHPTHRLQLITVRGRGLLREPENGLRAKAGFAAASFANLAGRKHLAKHMERVVIGDARDPALWLKNKFDCFDTHFCSLRQDNLVPALLASGTLPLIMEPVQHIPHAPIGTYWDGGIIDYHLALPYSRISAEMAGDLVLYPHFTDHIVPGWLDKSLAWRRANLGQNRHWLDNVIMVSPSKDFVKNLPRSKLPDRKDFAYYGLNHDTRIRHWQVAIAESARMRDAFASFVAQPDLSLVKSF